MYQIISRDELITSLSHSSELSKNLITSLQNGEISVVPFDGRYLFIADAFNHDSVKKIQFLRNTPSGTSLQVFVSSMAMAQGVTQSLSTQAMSIAEKFWPGPLTMLLQPHMMLNWNLGDDGLLNHFALRIPEEDYLRDLISAVGPIVIANANYLGNGAVRNITDLKIRDFDVSFIVDAGILEENEEFSTTIADNYSSGIEFIREGAIKFYEIKKVVGLQNHE